MKIVFAFLYFISLTGFAQLGTIKKDILFNHLTTRDGLSNNETTCIYEDKKGFIWIGTKDGLNFYSANRIITYRHEPKDSLSLPDNIVNALAEDNTGHLWISTNHGLSKMNLAKRKIEKIYTHNPEDPQSISTGSILLFDQQGRLWSAGFGIDLYDPSCDCFHHYANKSKHDKSNQITAWFQDSKARMWAGTQVGLYQFDPDTGNFTKLKWESSDAPASERSLPDPFITQIYEDHNHQLWLGTWGNGLIKFFPNEKKTVVYPIPNIATGKTSTFNIAGDISETKDSHNQYHLWVATDQGFSEFNAVGNEFYFHLNDPVDLRSPSAGNIRTLYTDRSGILWMLTDTDGVDILDPHRQVFKTHYFNSSDYAPAKKFGDVNSIFSDGDSTWVTSWYGNAVYILNKEFAVLKKWERVPPTSLSEENNRGNYVFKDKKGFFWIATLNGLHRLDSKSNSFKSYYHNEMDSSSLPRDRVVKYFEDSEGICWVCFYRKGICKFNPLTGKFYDYVGGPKDGDGDTMYFNIWDIMEDHGHNIWFADDGLGLWKYDRSTKELKRMFERELNEGHVPTVFEDASNIIWAATRNGLGKIQNGSLQLLTTADGLPTNTIFGARTDNQNRLWAITNHGMVLYDVAKNNFKIFKEEDGLEKTPVEGVVLDQLTDGRMVIGGDHYLTEFDPDEITLDQTKPSVFITDFKLFGSPNFWTETEKGKSVTLSYDQNQISFDFAVLNYSNPSENKFYYQLIGYDKDWTVSNQGFANYTNLDAGTYTFRVKGSNGDGAVNEDGDFITVTITPPFWKTWWFIMLSIIIVGLLIYALFRYRLEHALKLERFRTKISSDLHDDIGSTLSSISILSNIILQEGIMPSTRDMVSEINDNSVKLMERMDDIVWSINPQNDTLQGFLQRVRQFATSLFEAKGIDYEFDIQKDISGVTLSMEYRQHIYLILKEAVNNLVKYSECTKASVRISFLSSTLSVEIQDNGKGFLPSQLHDGNGLKSMKNRAQSMNAQLTIGSEPGNGTRILLLVKI